MDSHEQGTGREIGGYQILSTLGSGASGTVYRAMDGAGTLVALKVLHASLAADAEARLRLMREVTSLQKIAHPAIARVLDAEVDAAEPFLVTELIDWPSLEDEIMGGGPLDADDLRDLAVQLADALEAVHAAGLVHRDIKPSNILVTPDGPVLIDFGIAQEIADSWMTAHGFVMGTPGYLAPQMLDGEAPTAAVDWWGWAGSLVFAATGRAPFGVRPLETVLSRVHKGEVDVAGLGPITAAVLTAALAPDPLARPEPDVVLENLTLAAEQGETYQAPERSGPVPGMGTPEEVVRTSVLGGAGPTVAFPSAQAGHVGHAGADANRTLDHVPPTAKFEAQTAVVPYGTHPGDPQAMGGGHVPAFGAVAGADLTGTAEFTGTADYMGDGDMAGDLEAYARPQFRKRPWTLLALAVLPVLAAGLYPMVTAGVVLVVLVVLRTVAITFDSLHSRREVRGVRRTDGLRHVLALPWYLIRALGGLIPSLLVAASSSVILLGTLWWALQTNRWVPAPKPTLGGGDSGTGAVAEQVMAVGTANASWVFVVTLSLTALVALFVMWFGPLARPTREGARITLGTIAPGTGGGIGVALTILVIGSVLVLWLALEKPVVWWPFNGPPDLS